MDHYVLIVLYSSFTEEEQKYFTQYLKSVLADSHHFKYCAQFTSPVSFLLNPNLKYTAYLKSSNLENISWSGPHKKLDIEDIFLQDFDNNLSIKDEIQTIASSLHYLGDQLPAFGTYKLDIIISSNVLKDLTVSSAPELADAFYRFTRWHSACFNILIQNEEDEHKLNNWCEITNAYLINKNKLDMGPVLWRGSIEIQTENGAEAMCYPGFELRLDVEENDILNLVSSLNDNCLKRKSEHIILSSKLQVIDECHFTSIPSYVIYPMTFRLHLVKPNILNEHSFKFMEYLLKQNEFIVKLDYSVLAEKPKCGKMYYTNRWKRAVTSGFIKDANFLTSFESHIIFAITMSKQTGHIVAYPLRDLTTLNANFYFTIMQCSLLSSSDYHKSETNAAEKDLSSLPMVGTDLFQKVLQKEVKLKSELCKQSSLSKKTMEDMSSIWQYVYASINSNFKGNLTKMHIAEVDPCDWPERVYLLSEQMEGKKSTFSNMLSSLGPKLPLRCISVSSEDIRQHFLPSGEHKNDKDIEELCLVSSLIGTISNIEDVHSLKWPEISKCRYHDIYYNSKTQAEEKETVGNQMISCYIKYETLSSCNNHQIHQNHSIIVPETDDLSNSKEFRSPAGRKITNASSQKFHKDCKENTVKDLIHKKIINASRISSSQTILKHDNIPKKNKLCASKPYDAIRSSPRKKNRINYKVDGKKVDKSTNSNNLSEMVKKKLRHAVATALENHGINLTDSFFQPCGKRLFTICQAFIQDIPQKKGKTSEHLQKIADAHVKQVIEFEKQNKV